MSVRIMVGDVREVLQELPANSIDCIITDPPYGQTRLPWDKWRDGWLVSAARVLSHTGSMWVFGNLRLFMQHAPEFEEDWCFAQDVIWEKHNGSNPFADRFRRVHEQVAQFYSNMAPWSGVFKNPLFTSDETARTVRRKRRPPQWGHIEASSYKSDDGGPRLMRSVMFFRSEHGRAEHPTQKPVATILPLIEYSCPPGGTVLDPFCGSGSVGVAARQLGRNFIGIDIDPAYATMTERRIHDDAGLFASTTREASTP